MPKLAQHRAAHRGGEQLARCSHGLTRTWDDQGRLCREQRFEFGIKVSEKTFDEQGNVKNEWRISPSDNLYRTLELSRTKWGGSHRPFLCSAAVTIHAVTRPPKTGTTRVGSHVLR